MASIKNKDSKNPTQCFQCKHAHLMQWMENPIIAECDIRHKRFVAMNEHQCSLFEASSNSNPEITHYDQYEDTENF